MNGETLAVQLTADGSVLVDDGDFVVESTRSPQATSNQKNR